MKKISILLWPAALLLATGCAQNSAEKKAEKPAEVKAEVKTAAASKPADNEMAAKPGEKPAGQATPPPAAGDIPAPADVAAPPADAEKTASGLASKVLKAGSNDKHPAATDTVEVHYTGWTTDGKMFDSSVKRGQPTSFPLNRVIAGWTEGVQLMTIGEKRRFWIPENLAYQGRPGAPAGMLVFDVELLSIKEAPKAPADVAGPPKGAKKTKSGLAYKSLSPGKGAKPTPADRVQVHYTGWTTDGKMFDSSVMRGRPATFPLGGVIAGWTEGLQLMQVGEKMRFWIPQDLAYKGQRPPMGMLVFDVELLDIVK